MVKKLLSFFFRRVFFGLAMILGTVFTLTLKNSTLVEVSVGITLGFAVAVFFSDEWGPLSLFKDLGVICGVLTGLIPIFRVANWAKAGHDAPGFITLATFAGALILGRFITSAIESSVKLEQLDHICKKRKIETGP